VAIINGTPGDDVLAGTNENDTISGLAGNDTLWGSGGDDDLDGDAGNDRLDGGYGRDTLAGGDGTDVLIGGYGRDTLTGGDSADVLIGGYENDVLNGGAGDDRLEGGELGEGDDVLNGGAGNDLLSAVFDSFFLDRHVVMDGGTGIDTADFYGFSPQSVTVNLAAGTVNGDVVLTSIENVIGSDGGDTIIGNSDANFLSGDGGEFGGNDVLRGGAGDDVLYDSSTGTQDLLDGGDGIDTADYSQFYQNVRLNLQTGLGRDAGLLMVSIENLVGTAFDLDALTGNGGSNALSGLNGNDFLRGGGGADRLDGGSGIDTASYNEAGIGVVVDLSTGTASGGNAQGDVLVSIENLTGSLGSDRLTGDAGANVLAGDAGDDVLRGGAGADRLDGGAGSDTASYYDGTAGVAVDLAAGIGLAGEAKGDFLVSIENVNGSQGNDSLGGNASANVLAGWGGDDVLRGGAGADRLDGGIGSDTASYYTSAAGVTVDLAAGTLSGGDAQGDTLIGIENVTGSNQGNDTLSGTAGANTLAGWGGNDVLRGGAGADRLDGGVGSDTASYYGGTVGVTVNLSAGTGSGGDAQGDTYFAIEKVNGSQGNDSLSGNAAANTLAGWGGDDVLRGGAGADKLDGGVGSDTASYYNGTVGVTVNLATGTGAGGDAQGDSYVGVENVTGSTRADEITGSAVANALNGWAGQDVLRGGGGADRFVFTAASDSAVGKADRITDFSHVQGDRVDLSAIDANTAVAGDQAFSFIGSGAFTHQAGQLRAAVSGGVTTIAGDLNGDGVSDFQIQLTGAIGLVAADFVL
jgi:Ca2+-binding RTX toxin-like protein